MPVPASLPRGHRARRRLDFGPNEESGAAAVAAAASAPAPPSMDLERMLAEERARAQRRWNFDFTNEVPLPGPYEWERVEMPSSHPLARSSAPPNVEVSTSGEEAPPLVRPDVEPPTSGDGATSPPSMEAKVEDQPDVVVANDK